MPAELTSPTRLDCLLEIDDELDRMARRLRVLTSAASASQESLSEIITIYSNVAYLSVYLEGNARHLNQSLQQRGHFVKDLDQFAGILHWMSDLNCPDPAAEELKRIWMAWFRECAEAEGQAVHEKLEELLQSAEQALHRIQEDQAKLLQRLGVNTETANSCAIFYRIVSETQKTEMRSKLAQAWNRQRDRQVDELVDIVDQIVSIRRQQAKEKGFGSVLEQTLQRCSVSESEVRSFIGAYLLRALDSDSRLASNISKATGCTEKPMDHFGYFVRAGLIGTKLPMFSLEGCLDFIFTLSSCIFNLTVTRVGKECLHAIDVAVCSEGQRLGTIRFDLLDTGRLRFSIDGHSAIRAQSNSADVILEPASHVLCRFQQRSDGTRLVTFESAHSIFHEFGHALNHLLLRKRLPGHSGLDYLPVERLENLSSWFEKWVFHQDFGTHLFLSHEDQEGLTKCRHVKMLEFHQTNLERAVTAALDFDLHRRAEGGIRESLEELDKQFALSDRCSLGDLLEHFTAPMFRANPGAGFVYLWGSAYGSQNFAPFFDLSIEDIRAHKQIENKFSSCFDPDEPSTRPSIQAVFSFYDGILAA